jgi:hypothetical protein
MQSAGRARAVREERARVRHTRANEYTESCMLDLDL